MWTNEQIAEAASRPTAIEELHHSLRSQIDDDLLDRPADTIQSIFDRHALAVRRVSRATFYRYARKLRLLRSAADLDELLGPDGPSRAKLFTGIQNGLLYQLAEAVNAEEIDPGQIQKLTQSLKSLVTTDLSLQRNALRSDAPNGTGRASAGPERAQQPATLDVSPSAPATDSPQTLVNPYHIPDYFETERFPIEKLDPDNWHKIAAETYVDLWEFQKKMCIEQQLIPPECATLPAPDPQSILELPALPPEALEQKQFRARFAPLTTPDGFFIVFREPDNLKPRFKKIEEKEANWGRHSDGTPMMHAEFYADFREICYHRFPGLFPEPTDDEKAELKKNPSYWLWSRDPMRRAHPYGRKPDGTPRNHEEYQAEIDARSNPFQDRITQPPSRLLNGPNRTGSASAGPERAQQPAARDVSPKATDQQIRARGASPGPVTQLQPAAHDASPSTQAPKPATADDARATTAPIRAPSLGVAAATASSGREDQHPPATPDDAPSTTASDSFAIRTMPNASESTRKPDSPATVPHASDSANPIPDTPNHEPSNPLANHDSRPSSLGKYTTGGHEP